MGQPALNDLEYWRNENIQICLSSEYFIGKYCYIEDKGTGSAIPFSLWPEQLRVLSVIENAPRVIAIKAHQLGITWMFAAFALWLALTKPLQHIAIISANEDLAKEFLESRVRFILARLPEEVKVNLSRDSTELMEFDHLDVNGHPVRSIIQSLPSTEKGTQSKTPTLLIIDESALNRHTKSIYASSKPGIDAGKGRIVIISNPVKTAPGWPFTRHLYTGSMRNENDFTRIFMSWRARPDRPENFRELQLQQGMDEYDLPQRYPETEEEAISVLTGSYFGRVLGRHVYTMQGATGALVQRQGEREFQPDPKGILEIWRYPYCFVDGWDGAWWSRRYCIGSDVSEGLGLSYSVAYVYDRLLGEVVARLRSNRVDAYQWADLLFELSKWYQNAQAWHIGSVDYQTALICAERTGAGQTTVKRLHELGAVQYAKEVPGTMGAPVTKELGWSETNQAKHNLSEDLRHWFKTTKGTVYCSHLIDEASTWIQAEGTNKLGPEEGHFGDCVIAAGCAIQADHFIGSPPKKLRPPVTGWRAKLDKGEGESVWAL
jgi:hypothetical protein